MIIYGSVVLLGFVVGMKVFVFVKVLLVIVMVDVDSSKVLVCNCVMGIVVLVVKGVVNLEVVIKVVGGVEIVVIVINDSVDCFGFVSGIVVFVIFKVLSVIVGVE